MFVIILKMFCTRCFLGPHTTQCTTYTMCLDKFQSATTDTVLLYCWQMMVTVVEVVMIVKLLKMILFNAPVRVLLAARCCDNNEHEHILDEYGTFRDRNTTTPVDQRQSISHQPPARSGQMVCTVM